jgi:hypothetical protein
MPALEVPDGIPRFKLVPEPRITNGSLMGLILSQQMDATTRPFSDFLNKVLQLVVFDDRADRNSKRLLKQYWVRLLLQHLHRD